MADGLQNRGKYLSPCFAMRRCSFSLAPLPKLALGAAAALAAISLSPGSAQAACAPGTDSSICRVTVNSVQYDVTTFTGSYNGNVGKFETSANGGEMPWWGNSALANSFAAAVGGNLGYPNQPGANLQGLWFAWNTIQGLYWYPWVYAYTQEGTVVSGADSPGGTGLNSRADYVWAQATLYSGSAASAPGPLPLLGAGAAFGFSRKLRKRIKLAPAALGSSLPLA